MATVEELQRQVQLLEQTIVELKTAQMVKSARGKIEKMSDEVVDANPYR